MDVRVLLLARYAEFAPDGSVTMVGALKDLYRVASLPLSFPCLYVVSSIVFAKEETTVQRKLKYELLRPDDEVFLSTDEMTVAATDTVPGDRKYMDVNSMMVLFNVVLNHEGYYRLRLLLDGHVVKESIFNVEVETPAAPASS